MGVLGRFHPLFFMLLCWGLAYAGSKKTRITQEEVRSNSACAGALLPTLVSALHLGFTREEMSMSAVQSFPNCYSVVEGTGNSRRT